MTLTKTGLRVRQVHDESLMIWGQLKAVVEPAAREERYLNDDEEHIYYAGLAKLEELEAEQRALEAQQQPKPQARKPSDVKDRLRQDRLEMQKIEGERTKDAIVEHDRRDRARQLNNQLTAAEVAQAAAERDMQLAHQARMAELGALSIKFSEHS